MQNSAKTLFSSPIYKLNVSKYTKRMWLYDCLTNELFIPHTTRSFYRIDFFHNLCWKCAWWVYRNGFKGSILRKVHVLDYSTSVEKNDAKKIKRNFYTNDSRIKLWPKKIVFAPNVFTSMILGIESYIYY